jgi:hypothetical protein
MCPAPTDRRIAICPLSGRAVSYTRIAVKGLPTLIRTMLLHIFLYSHYGDLWQAHI